MDIVRLALTGRLRLDIRSKGQMDSADREAENYNCKNAINETYNEIMAENKVDFKWFTRF